MGVTAKEIAEICGVSRTTVNRAFTNTGRINQETKNKILQVAKELEYRPDLLATGLKNGKTGYLGVVILGVDNRYFAQMLNAIEIEAKAKKYYINITLHEKDKQQEQEMIQRLVDYRVEGLILSPVSKGDAFGNYLRKMEKPIVIIGNRVDKEIPFVGIDEKQAARDAVKTIIKKNYHNIVFVCPPLADVETENVYQHEQREKGFLDEIVKYDNVHYEIIKSWTYLQQVSKILNENSEKTAFFCSGDIFALEIMKYLNKAGKRAGRDYGIMGFDNIDTLDYIIPRLSTIDNVVKKVATKAVTILFDLMDGKEVAKKTLVQYVEIKGETL